MEYFVAISAGVLFACGLYCLLQGHFIRIVTGVVLLSNAINLLIFSVGRIQKDKAPLISDTAEQILTPTTNPLAGAMILTSIVIGLGVASFTIALVMRSFSQSGTSFFPELHRRSETLDE